MAQLYERAKTIVVSKQTVSISLLQRHFFIDYNAALCLMDDLESNGVVTRLSADGRRKLTSRYAFPLITQDPMNERDKYVRRIFETALFFRDMYEENNDGSTIAIGLVKPIRGAKNSDVRKFVLYDLYRTCGLSLTEAALQLAAWQPNCQERLPYNVDSIEADLRALCLEYERDIRSVAGPELVERSFLRAARYILRMLTEGASAHSRIVEVFVPDAFVPRGAGKNGPGHREHVVPCVFLRDAGLDLFRKGASIDEVARFLRRYVVIVDISVPEQKYLDGSLTSGGLGLKNSMPAGWDLQTGCIFQRLHDAAIKFDPPDGFAECAH